METLLEKSSLDKYVAGLNDETLNGDFDAIFKNAPMSKDTHCGFGPFRGRFFQKFANKKCFIFVFGVVGLIFASSHAYYNGTISTMEKRFKISSRNMGFIATGNDITSFILSTLIAYYGGKGHRPKWMAFGILTIVIYCLMNAAPHLIYGPGEDALALTVEHGGVRDEEQTKAIQEINNKKLLCQRNVTEGTGLTCQKNDGNVVAQLYLFGAQLIAGVGQSLKHTLGISFLDDNIKKSKTPALISLSYFIRLLGPFFGYGLSSISLKFYIAPNLTPVIDNRDPRWIGAWYLGWIVIGCVLFSFSIIMAFFPKELPRAALRKRIAIEIEKRKNVSKMIFKEKIEEVTSLKDFYIAFKRLLRNKLFMLNNLSGVCTIFGLMPFWIYSPKLIETLFRQTSSASALYTGTFALLASAAGILVAGIVISKFKPSARYLSFWNVIVGILTVLAVVSFSFMGCDESKDAVNIDYDVNPSCNADCQCDFVKYSPVCGADGSTFISACHAGCESVTVRNGTKLFRECACIDAVVHHQFKQTAKVGPCPVDCKSKLMMFLAVMCIMKFLGASGRASNFLVGIRCVEEKDKTLAIGLGMSMIRLLASVPSPIAFGYLIDSACLAWGKTCTTKGNCWLYDGEVLRVWFFYPSAIAIAIGTLFDYLVWKNAKDLKIFDEKVEIIEKKIQIEEIREEKIENQKV